MKLLTVVGARPQFIKAAPLSRAIARHNKKDPERRLREILLHTGQHYDRGMSQVFFDELELRPPDYNLGIGSGPQGEQTGRMLEAIETVLLAERPDWVLVYGDTNSTLAGALAAAKLHIPLAHVEAGLRSFNRQMPEEINRLLADHLSNLLFCPTGTAVKNLAGEGITQGVHQVGDVMYDSVRYNTQLARKRSQILAQLKLRPKNYALATVHRAENTDDAQRLGSIIRALETIADEGMPVILPLHPRTRKALQAAALSPEHIRLVAPVSYLDMLLLEQNARLILTDSGGVQKEAFFFRVPCVTLREETEWPETVQSGWNVLVGSDTERIIRAAGAAGPGAESGSPYGEGRAAERIVTILCETAG